VNIIGNVYLVELSRFVVLLPNHRQVGKLPCTAGCIARNYVDEKAFFYRTMVLAQLSIKYFLRIPTKLMKKSSVKLKFFDKTQLLLCFRECFEATKTRQRHNINSLTNNPDQYCTKR